MGGEREKKGGGIKRKGDLMTERKEVDGRKSSEGRGGVRRRKGQESSDEEPASNLEYPSKKKKREG